MKSILWRRLGESFWGLAAIENVLCMRYAAFGAKKYQSLVEHIPLDSFVRMPDVLGIGAYF
jgi:hypothetical protein